jgi:hypothetical protein
MFVLLLGACATIPTEGTPAAEEKITVAAGPCFGFCPVYEASLAADGKVRFIGLRHTAFIGKRTGSVPASTFLSLARDLSPYRPANGIYQLVECTAEVSDTTVYTITWTDSRGRQTSAKVQSGCPGGPARELSSILRSVPERMGIGTWATQTTRPGASRG